MDRVLERTPLIGSGRRDDEERQAPASDHPIFLRAAHSPWRPLNQNALGYIRGGLLAYLIASGGMLLDYKIKHREDEHTNWRIPFQFSTVTWVLLIIYHILVFSWTITHMHWPDIDPGDGRWESKLLRFMSPPEQTADSRKRFYFSLFYTVTHVFALLNVFIYWTLQVPSGHAHWPGNGGDGGGDAGFFVIVDDGDSKLPPFKDIFGGGWFPAFSIFNTHVFPAIATVIESLFLNSMRRQEPVPSHLFGTMAAAALYLGYGAIGKLATGHNPFWWMDEGLAGSKEKVAGYCTGFVSLAAAMFSTLYGLIGMRENAFHSR
ncbi:hypothetical protein N0V93_009975 [Gnomoniopsis smithogilvyi]|uniref:Uncharacterized protein n=1 Tax=Gnomoniopsis smithogilvyi TaxID=1191159 RepID=A0A9W8YKA0_9PEZI|nr:hypothetical protein N0V93_009975 [Gnomoniopsis smithogilvyi]